MGEAQYNDLATTLRNRYINTTHNTVCNFVLGQGAQKLSAKVAM